MEVQRMNADSSAQPDALAAIEARLAAINGFEHIHHPDHVFHRDTLAEWGADGKWRAWDMKAPYSTEACVFIAHAPADIAFLLARVRALEQALGEIIEDTGDIMPGWSFYIDANNYGCSYCGALSTMTEHKRFMFQHDDACPVAVGATLMAHLALAQRDEPY